MTESDTIKWFQSGKPPSASSADKGFNMSLFQKKPSSSQKDYDQTNVRSNNNLRTRIARKRSFTMTTKDRPLPAIRTRKTSAVEAEYALRSRLEMLKNRVESQVIDQLIDLLDVIISKKRVPIALPSLDEINLAAHQHYFDAKKADEKIDAYIMGGLFVKKAAQS